MMATCSSRSLFIASFIVIIGSYFLFLYDPIIFSSFMYFFFFFFFWPIFPNFLVTKAPRKEYILVSIKVDHFDIGVSEALMNQKRTCELKNITERKSGGKRAQKLYFGWYPTDEATCMCTVNHHFFQLFEPLTI